MYSEHRIDLVLDHSALIPCSHKPQEEKSAIYDLGEALPTINAVWHISRDFLKALKGKFCKLEKRETLPRLQRVLVSKIGLLLEKASVKSAFCKPWSLDHYWHLKFHVVARSALKYLAEAEMYQNLYRELEHVDSEFKLNNEDKEVVATAIILAKQSVDYPLVLVTTDSGIEDFVKKINENEGLHREINVLKPSRLLEMLHGQKIQAVNH